MWEHCKVVGEYEKMIETQDHTKNWNFFKCPKGDYSKEVTKKIYMCSWESNYLCKWNFKLKFFVIVAYENFLQECNEISHFNYQKLKILLKILKREMGQESSN
jgi:hypothetical protein